MKNRIIAALLVVSLTGCSIAPRAPWQSAANTEVTAQDILPETGLPVEKAAEDFLPVSDAGDETKPRVSEAAKVLAALVLLTLAIIAAGRANRSMTRSFESSCCVR